MMLHGIPQTKIHKKPYQRVSANRLTFEQIICYICGTTSHQGYHPRYFEMVKASHSCFCLLLAHLYCFYFYEFYQIYFMKLLS